MLLRYSKLFIGAGYNVYSRYISTLHISQSYKLEDEQEWKKKMSERIMAHEKLLNEIKTQLETLQNNTNQLLINTIWDGNDYIIHYSSSQNDDSKIKRNGE